MPRTILIIIPHVPSIVFLDISLTRHTENFRKIRNDTCRSSSNKRLLSLRQFTLGINTTVRRVNDEVTQKKTERGREKKGVTYFLRIRTIRRKEMNERTNERMADLAARLQFLCKALSNKWKADSSDIPNLRRKISKLERGPAKKILRRFQTTTIGGGELRETNFFFVSFFRFSLLFFFP